MIFNAQHIMIITDLNQYSLKGELRLFGKPPQNNSSADLNQYSLKGELRQIIQQNGNTCFVYLNQYSLKGELRLAHVLFALISLLI